MNAIAIHEQNIHNIRIVEYTIRQQCIVLTVLAASTSIAENDNVF